MELGAQCQEKGDAIYEFNKVVRPNNVKAINVVDRDFWQRIWVENPQLKYAIYREVPNRDNPFTDPEGAAVAWVTFLRGKISHLVDEGLITHIEGYNEWIHSFQQDLFDEADRFMAKIINETHKQFGGKVHAVVLNASCGHFNDTDITSFPLTLVKLNECPDCKLGLHEYDRDDMDRTYPHRCGKFQLVEKGLKEAGFGNVRIALTEVGLDAHVDSANPHGGWLIYGNTVEEAVAHFLDDHNLGWYYPLLMESDMVDLASIFGCQMFRENNWGEWGFDIKDGFPALLYGIRDLAETEPEPEDEMKVKVFRSDGMQLSEAEAAEEIARFGVSFDRAEEKFGTLPAGSLVWRLTEFWIKTGDVSLITKVLNEAGQPVENADVTFYWPDAPADPTATANDWYPNFVHGPTNVNGEVGPGMGPGAYHGEYECGPHKIWVRGVPSDCATCQGMLAGTNHDHLDQVFQRFVVGENGEEPTGDTLIFKHIIQQPHDNNMIGVAIDAAYAIKTDARGQFDGPGINQSPIHPVEWIHPDGTKMALMEGCTSFNGADGEERTYILFAFNLATGDELTDPVTETFLSLESGVGTERVVYVYELVSEEPEDPEEPEPTDLGDRIRTVIQELGNIANEVDELGTSVTKVKLIMADGTEREFAPVAPTSLWARFRKLIGR